jgi:transporter family protein
MWIIYAFGSALFAGITAILVKAGMCTADSSLATAIRTIVVLIFAWIMVFITGSQSSLGTVDARTFMFLALSGLATGASWLCCFKAMQLGDVNKVTPVDKSSVALTMLLAFIILGEPLTLLGGAALMLILAGTLLMIQKKETDAKKTDRRWLFYAVLSAVFAALTSILGKIGIQNVESNLGTAIRTVVVLVMAWLIVFARGKQSGIKAIDRKSWLFLLLSGVATGASWLCYYHALQQGPASVVAPIDKLSIVLTVAFAYFFLGEKLTKKALAGLAMIVAGTLMLLM